MSRASSLHRLQRQDQELDSLRSRLAAIEAELAAAGGLQGSRVNLEIANRELEAARAGHAYAENEVAVLRAKIDVTDATMYGGSVRNPKELTDLQQESASLRRHLGTLEDRLLEAMVSLESAENAHESARAALGGAESGWQQTREELVASRATLSQQVERLEGEREATMASVPPADLRLYDSLRQSYGGTAVAEVREATCTACGLTLAASIEQTVRNNPELVRCRQCNRILYAG